MHLLAPHPHLPKDSATAPEQLGCMGHSLEMAGGPVPLTAQVRVITWRESCPGAVQKQVKVTQIVSVCVYTPE